MKKLALVMLVLVIGLIAFGFYRDWFGLSSSRESQSNKVNVNLTVDPDKIKEDAERVKERTSEIGENLKEEVR
jgi:hypothetical protein